MVPFIVFRLPEATYTKSADIATFNLVMYMLVIGSSARNSSSRLARIILLDKSTYTKSADKSTY